MAAPCPRAQHADGGGTPTGPHRTERGVEGTQPDGNGLAQGVVREDQKGTGSLGCDHLRVHEAALDVGGHQGWILAGTPGVGVTAPAPLGIDTNQQVAPRKPRHRQLLHKPVGKIGLILPVMHAVQVVFQLGLQALGAITGMAALQVLEAEEVLHTIPNFLGIELHGEGLPPPP